MSNSNGSMNLGNMGSLKLGNNSGTSKVGKVLMYTIGAVIIVVILVTIHQVTIPVVRLHNPALPCRPSLGCDVGLGGDGHFSHQYSTGLAHNPFARTPFHESQLSRTI